MVRQESGEAVETIYLPVGLKAATQHIGAAARHGVLHRRQWHAVPPPTGGEGRIELSGRQMLLIRGNGRLDRCPEYRYP